MFRIGEFSRIAQTAVTQLRYYDEIGLFQPETTDSETGYRYYSASQLPALNRILAMKGLGLSLEQIKRLSNDNVSADELRGMLVLKKAQAEQELQAQVVQLNQIEARLQQIDQEGNSSFDDILIKELPAQPFLSFRTTLPHIRQSQQHLKEMRQLLPSRVGIKALSHFTAVYHGEAFSVEDVDIELGFLLNATVNEQFQLNSGHELSVRTLPEVKTAVSVVRVGGPSKSLKSYANLGIWMERNGYKMAGLVREVFIVPPNFAKLDETVCELQIPVVSTSSTQMLT